MERNEEDSNSEAANSQSMFINLKRVLDKANKIYIIALRSDEIDEMLYATV